MSRRSRADRRREAEPTPAPAPTPWSGAQQASVALALALATVVPYLQVGSHQFLNLDDDLYVTANPVVAAGLSWSGVKWAFSTFTAVNWHPVTWLSHMLDCQLFGMDPGPHHLVSVGIHVINSLLLFVLLSRAAGKGGAAALVAALFALHPLHVESVAWVAERKDVLSTFFGLLSLLAYERYARTGSRARLALSVVALALGLMAKPMLVTWPIVMLLLDYWPLGRLREPSVAALLPLIREKAPMLALSIASSIVTVGAQSAGGAVRSLVEAPPALRVANALASYVTYVVKMAWPSGLAVYYPFTADDGTPLLGLGALIVLALVSALVVRGVRGGARGYLLVGWGLYLVTLLPVIGIVQAGGQARADRYTYFPSVGIFIVVAYGLADLVERGVVRRDVAVAGCLAGLVALTSLTRARVALFHDSETLYVSTLAVAGESFVIDYDLAHALGAVGRYEDALPHYEAALRILPDNEDALAGRGSTLVSLGRFSEAVPSLRRVVQLRPRTASAHADLGVALAQSGGVEEAIVELRTAASLAPTDSNVQSNLGLALARAGDLAGAERCLAEALRLDPENAVAHNNAGLLLMAQGRFGESLVRFQTALRLKPGFQKAQENLARAESLRAKQGTAVP